MFNISIEYHFFFAVKSFFASENEQPHIVKLTVSTRVEQRGAEAEKANLVEDDV